MSQQIAQPLFVMQAYAVKGEADKDWYGDLSAVTFVLKELLTISPQLCDPMSSVAWKAFLLRLAAWRSSRSSLQSVGMCLQHITCFAGLHPARGVCLLKPAWLCTHVLSS